MKAGWLLCLLFSPLCFATVCEESLLSRAAKAFAKRPEFSLNKYNGWLSKGIDELDLLRSLPLGQRLTALHFAIKRDPHGGEKVAPSLNGTVADYQKLIESISGSEYHVYIWNTLTLLDAIFLREQELAAFSPAIGDFDVNRLFRVFAEASYTWKGALTGFMLSRVPALGAELEVKWIETFKAANSIQQKQLIKFIHSAPLASTPRMMALIKAQVPSRSHEYNLLVAQATRDSDLPTFWKAARPILLSTETAHANAMLSSVRLPVDNTVFDPDKFSAADFFKTAPSDFDAIMMRLLIRNTAIHLQEPVERIITHLGFIVNWSPLTQRRFVEFLDAWAEDPEKVMPHLSLIRVLAMREPLSNREARLKAVQVLHRIEILWNQDDFRRPPAMQDVLQRAIQNNSI